MHRPEQRCVWLEGSRQEPGKQAWLGDMQVKGDSEAAVLETHVARAKF